MSSQNVRRLVDNDTESSPSKKRVRQLNEEDVSTGEECLSVGVLPTDNSNDDKADSSERSKGYNRDKNSSSSIEHELESSEEQAGENYFNQLSDEMLLEIFKRVPKRSLNRLSLVCHQFNRVIQDRSLWTEMDVSAQTISDTCFGKILSQDVIALAAYYCEVQGLTLPPPLSDDFKAHLRYLDLGSAKISSSTLVELFNHCDQIKMLSLQRVPVNDEVLMALSANKDLEALNFSESSGITEEGLRSLLPNCRKIRELNLDWTSLSRTAAEYLCNNLPGSVDKLSITACYNITNEHVSNLVRCCPHLRELDLSDCMWLSREVISSIITLKDLQCFALTPDNDSHLDHLSRLKGIDSLLYLNIHSVSVVSLIFLRTTLEPKVQINKRTPHSTARWNIWDRMVQDWSWA